MKKMPVLSKDELKKVNGGLTPIEILVFRAIIVIILALGPPFTKEISTVARETFPI